MLRQAGPQGFAQGLVQGQEQQQANALAQQKMGQEQEMNALRVQQLRGAIGEQETGRKKQAQLEKTSMFRERLLRAPTPEAAREIVKMQYADPDIGPVLSQGGTLEQSLAEVSDDPQLFERYKQQEALGMSEWMKSQMPKITPTGDVYDPASRSYIRKPQPIAAPGTPMAVFGPDGKPTYVSREEAFGKTPFTSAAVKFMQPPAPASIGGAAGKNVSLGDAETQALSKAVIEGRLDPNRITGRNAKILAATLLSDPTANLLELGVSAGGAMASEKSLATQTAKMSTAANEANKMVDVVRGLSNKVDRGEFPSINAISNAVAKGTGNKEIVQLNTSINALVNSYARAISPTGQPTVSDKNHARDIINSAYSQGQMGAILDVMQQEMAIARQAAGTASTELKASRETARGRTSEIKLAPADQQALDWATTNPTDPRAAQIKQRLGR